MGIRAAREAAPCFGGGSARLLLVFASPLAMPSFSQAKSSDFSYRGQGEQRLAGDTAQESAPTLRAARAWAISAQLQCELLFSQLAL